MAKLIYSTLESLDGYIADGDGNIMSLDGYVEVPGGDVMALPMDDFFDAHNLERLRAADPGVSPAVANNPEVADLHRAVAELKERPGKDILTFGSRTLWNDPLVDARRRNGSDNLLVRYEVVSRDG